jgi:KUP system potassium uptake protein
MLSYAGQTALLIENPSLTGNPFFKLAPSGAVIPLVVLATVATIIASQAIITGAFSLTRQAMQLGWFPGLMIRQTSDEEYGQIYVPFVNWMMMIGTLGVAAAFGSSDRLAGAYGTAISTTMLLTTALLYNAMRDIWGWPKMLAQFTSGVFLLVDIAFFAANLLKVRQGGWFPLVFGALVFMVMTTWHKGVAAVRRKQAEDKESAAAFVAKVSEAGGIARLPGTAVFLSRGGTAVPRQLLRHAAQFKALHETVVTLTVGFDQVPRVPAADRAVTEHVTDGLWHVNVRFGFVEVPNLALALAHAKDQGCQISLDEALYFAERDEVVRSKTRPRLSGWRRMLFGFMYRNAIRTPDRFDLPADRFIEISRQVEL